MSGRVTVPEVDMVAEEPWRLCLQAGYSIERIKEGGAEAELPQDALHFATLWEYLGEVTNGGHAQYHENEEDCISQLPGMQGLLRYIGLPNHAVLLSDFERVVIKNEDYITDLWSSGDNQTAKALFYDIDERFAELELAEGNIQDKLRVWLAQQSWIVTEDDQGRR